MTTKAIKTGPKRTAISTGKPDQRHRDNKGTHKRLVAKEEAEYRFNRGCNIRQVNFEKQINENIHGTSGNLSASSSRRNLRRDCWKEKRRKNWKKMGVKWIYEDTQPPCSSPHHMKASTMYRKCGEMIRRRAQRMVKSSIQLSISILTKLADVILAPPYLVSEWTKQMRGPTYRHVRAYASAMQIGTFLPKLAQMCAYRGIALLPVSDSKLPSCWK